MVDVTGQPVHQILTKGQRADELEGPDLTEQIDNGSPLLVDKAYRTNSIHNAGRERQGQDLILSKSYLMESFAFSGWLYKYRNRVELFFTKVSNSEASRPEMTAC